MKRKHSLSILLLWTLITYLPNTNGQSSQEVGTRILLALASTDTFSNLFRAKQQRLLAKCSENIAESGYQEQIQQGVTDTFGTVGEGVYFSDTGGLLIWEPAFIKLKPDYLSIKSENTKVVHAQLSPEAHYEEFRCPRANTPFLFLMTSDKNGYLWLVIFSINEQGQLVDTSLSLNLHLADPFTELFLKEVTKYNNVVLNLSNWPVLVSWTGENTGTFAFQIALDEDDSSKTLWENDLNSSRQLFGIMTKGQFFPMGSTLTGQQLMNQPNQSGHTTFSKSRIVSDDISSKKQKAKIAEQSAPKKKDSDTFVAQGQVYRSFIPGESWSSSASNTQTGKTKPDLEVKPSSTALPYNPFRIKVSPSAEVSPPIKPPSRRPQTNSPKNKSSSDKSERRSEQKTGTNKSQASSLHSGLSSEKTSSTRGAHPIANNQVYKKQQTQTTKPPEGNWVQHSKRHMPHKNTRKDDECEQSDIIFWDDLEKDIAKDTEDMPRTTYFSQSHTAILEFMGRDITKKEQDLLDSIDTGYALIDYTIFDELIEIWKKNNQSSDNILFMIDNWKTSDRITVEKAAELVKLVTTD